MKTGKDTADTGKITREEILAAEEEKRLQAEIINLQIYGLVSQLDAPTSDVGDWKIVKIYEARMAGLDDPYDFDELHAARQEIRDKINELQAELDTLEKGAKT